MDSTLCVRFHRSVFPGVAAVFAGAALACGGTASSPEATSPTDTAAPPQTGPDATPTTDELACQVPTVKASDNRADCFDGFGQPGECFGLDFIEIESGLLAGLPDGADVPGLPTGFVVTFADPVAGQEEFGLFFYLDLDQDPSTGLDMSSGPIVLPGIDRIVGASLPAGESWTQAVGHGGYDAEIIKDPALVFFRVVDDRATLLVDRKLLEEASVGGREGSSVLTVGRVTAGAMPDAFALYVGTARNLQALDYLNVEDDIQVPFSLTVRQEALYPPCPGGS